MAFVNEPEEKVVWYDTSIHRCDLHVRWKAATEVGKDIIFHKVVEKLLFFSGYFHA